MTLIEKLKAATGPDRELDAEVLALARSWTFEREGQTAYLVKPDDSHETVGRYDEHGELYVYLRDLPHLSASIDAALALVAEVLPGMQSKMVTRATMLIRREHKLYMRTWREGEDGIYSEVLARYILIALITAIDKQNTETVT